MPDQPLPQKTKNPSKCSKQNPNLLPNNLLLDQPPKNFPQQKFVTKIRATYDSMRIMELSQKHNISEKDIEIFNITYQQQLFIEEYLSNGMKSTAAAKHAVDATSPEIKKKNNPDTYYSMRAKSFLTAKAISGYLDKTLHKKSNAATLDEVLKVVSSIMHDEDAENKDRLKGAELLLKHYGAFEKHQNARATKSLTYNNIGAMTDKELEIELKKRLTQASGSDEAQIVD